MINHPKPVYILLVEDNHMDEVLTLDAFREVKLKNTIYVVRSGEEALAYLLGEGDYADRILFPLPDLILLDIKLPGISGYDVLAKVKTMPVIKRIPAIILTSSKEEGDLIMSYDRGANSYLVKPINYEGFLEVVHSLGKYWLSINVSPPK